ncbi:MAG: cytochrome c [Pseudomonadales bacterium]|nr:cytochrome c [Nitrospira sp.]MCP5331659.1 cytochrome c [Pseudomonadales bacterium]MCP5343309.1 cytochrome c [Pseudomonadales bacterium]
MRAVIAITLFTLLSPLSHGADDNQGKRLYTMYCTQCHGVHGNGLGVNSSRMSVQPRSHIEREEMMARSDEELFKVIQQGGKSIDKSNLMPAWGDNLNEEEISALVAHLRQLCCEENGNE